MLKITRRRSERAYNKDRGLIRPRCSRNVVTRLTPDGAQTNQLEVPQQRAPEGLAVTALRRKLPLIAPEVPLVGRRVKEASLVAAAVAVLAAAVAEAAAAVAGGGDSIR